MRVNVPGKTLLSLLLLAFTSRLSAAPTTKSNKQVGLGFGTVSAYPVTDFPYALMAVLEGTYRYKAFGLSILATATSSPLTEGAYWFGSNGSFQQTFVEPRVYLSVFKIGFAVGMNLSAGTEGEIQSVVSYGPMFGIEVPLGKVSLGIDSRYILTSEANPSPLSTVMMFRFRF